MYNLDYGSNRLAPFGGSDSANAFSIGSRIDTGLKFGGTRFFVEPQASLAYVATSIDNIAVGGSTVAFEDAQSLRGRLGVRIGGEVARFTNATLGAAVTGSVWQEFLGDNAVNILRAGRSSGRPTNSIKHTARWPARSISAASAAVSPAI